MILIENENVGGVNYGLYGTIPIGTCESPAGNEIKACSFTDSFPLNAGKSVVVKFTYANTYGDGSTTWPKLQINGTSYPIKLLTGAYAGTGAWANGQTVIFLFDGTDMLKVA